MNGSAPAWSNVSVMYFCFNFLLLELSLFWGGRGGVSWCCICSDSNGLWCGALRFYVARIPLSVFQFMCLGVRCPGIGIFSERLLRSVLQPFKLQAFFLILFARFVASPEISARVSLLIKHFGRSQRSVSPDCEAAHVKSVRVAGSTNRRFTCWLVFYATMQT